VFYREWIRGEIKTVHLYSFYFKLIMLQLSNNVLVLNVGDQIPEPSGDAIKIYLAGSEDLNPANEKWQDKLCNAMVTLTEGPGAISVFKNKNWIFINPLMAPQMNKVPNMSNPEFVNKVTWETDMLNAADGIFLNFLKRSVSPLPLYTFGLVACSGKLVVRCSEEYFQYGLINFMCGRHGIPLLPNKSTVKDVIWAFFSLLPGLQQNQKLQLPE
jgi:hypothetical protein